MNWTVLAFFIVGSCVSFLGVIIGSVITRYDENRHRQDEVD